MPKVQQPILTFTEAFEKYFGKVNDQKLRYPFTCKCGTEFLSMTEDKIWDHIRDAHKEKVMSEKMKASLERRRAERESKEKKESGIASAILQSLKN